MATLGDSTGPDGQSGPAAASEAGAVSRAWLAWRRWRRTRPFWGGLLVILGATEMLASERAPLPIIVHVGIQGLAGYLIPIVLGLCGFLLWFHPLQQSFYSVLAVLLALGSWVTSNLGGFFVGMLLGLIGGSLAFAWTRSGNPEPPRPVPMEQPKKVPSEGLDLILSDPYSDASEDPYTDPSEDWPTDPGRHEPRGGGRVHYGNGEGGREPRREADDDEPGGARRYRSAILAIPIMLSVVVALPRHGPVPSHSWRAIPGRDVALSQAAGRGNVVKRSSHIERDPVVNRDLDPSHNTHPDGDADAHSVTYADSDTDETESESESGPGNCPSKGMLSAEFGPVVNTSVKGHPHVFVN